ncbi:MAG: alpha/beta fold hydrolase [Candidatus Hydrogenedentes bacterium]|nr:alpha/beta fold hydrolase [Candidatus Hydrogenedentota bacterium]
MNGTAESKVPILHVSGTGPAGAGLRHRMRRHALVGMIVLGLLVIGVLIYDVAAIFLVRAEERNTKRDPVTGIAIGAEEKTLGPEDAPGAVLFVHGFVGGSNNFADVPEAVARRGWRVRVMRLPGHGTSPADFARTTPDELIEAVRAEVTALRAKYPSVVLVGHSMGATLCTLVAAEQPVDGLILAAPYFLVTYHWYYLLPPETWVRLGAPLLPWVYKGKLFLQVNRRSSKPHIYSYTWVPADGMKTLMELGRRAAAPEVLGRIQCPVLLLHSPRDVAASYESAQDAFFKMSSTTKRIIALTKSNHHVFWDNEQEEVRDLVAFYTSSALRHEVPPDGDEPPRRRRLRDRDDRDPRRRTD